MSTALKTRVTRSVHAATVPGWELLRLCGRGNWSQVFQARPAGSEPDAPGDYAIKLLGEQLEDQDLAIAQLHRESRVASTVSDPHLIPVLSTHLQQSPRHLVMPYLAGSSLRDLIAAHGPISTPVALWIARQIAEALGKLHAAGWLHADVSPGNIVVTPEGHATLIDLGLARRLNSEESQPGGPLIGTLAYTAPETLSNSVEQTAAADVYGLGVVLYEMLAGRPPFAGEMTAQLIRAHLQQRPPRLRTAAPRLSPRTARIVEQMLAKQPLRRPTTDELRETLASLEIELFAERAG